MSRPEVPGRVEAPPERPIDAWGPPVAWTGLGLSLLALVVRYLSIATASYSYDEATYVELGRHPWTSSYYPDAFFARHPPLAFVLLGAWTSVTGESEWSARLLGLMITMAAVVVVWRAVRRQVGDVEAGLAAILTGGSLLALVYGVQATLYPLSFLVAALVADAHADKNDRREVLALSLLALSHLFGFLFVAVRLWQRRRAWRSELPRFAAPLLWLLAATILVLAFRNQAGPGLGPLWQPTRLLEFPYQLIVGDTDLALHVVAFGVLATTLYPTSFVPIGRLARARDGVAVATVILLVFLFTGPTFLRFGLILLPFVVLLGARLLVDRRQAAAAAAALVVGLASGSWYLDSGFDPRAQNDVPGVIDWRGAAELFHQRNGTTLVGAAPTTLAYYLETRHGYQLLGAAEGPDILPMGRGQDRVEVRLLGPRTDLSPLSGAGLIVLVNEASKLPATSPAQEPCGALRGLRVYCGS